MSEAEIAAPEETLEERYSRILEEHEWALMGISTTLMELAGRVSQLEAERVGKES